MSENSNMKVISETKNNHGKVFKRMVIEIWPIKKGKKASATYHEKLSHDGSWNRCERFIETTKKKKKNKYKKGKKK